MYIRAVNLQRVIGMTLRSILELANRHREQRLAIFVLPISSVPINIFEQKALSEKYLRFSTSWRLTLRSSSLHETAIPT